MGSLPEGYRVSYYKYGPPQPSDPMVFTLSRPDHSTVSDFVLGDLKEVMRAIEVAAWRDHRGRTLRQWYSHGHGSRGAREVPGASLGDLISDC